MPATFEHLPTWLLSRASQRGHRILHAALGELGATGYDYRVLSALAHAPDGVAAQVDIGRVAALDRRDVTVTVRGLEAGGYVTRRRDPSDARVQRVALTDAGRARHRELELAALAAQDDVLSPLRASERARLLDLLAKLRAGDDAPSSEPHAKG